MPFETAAPPPAPTHRPPQEPVGVGSLISRTFSVWSKHMWLFAGFTLVVMIPAIIAMVVAMAGTLFAAGAAGGLEAGEPDPSTVLSAMIPMLTIGLPVLMVAAIVNMGGLTYGAIQGLAGRPVRFGTLFSVGFGRLFPLLGAGILAGILIALGLALLIVPGVIVACGFIAVIPVVVAEKIGPIDAIGRSWNLTRGYKGTIFVSGLVFVAINIGTTIAASILGLIPILGQLASLLINLLMASLYTVWPAVAYHDVRVAKEGIGTEDLAKVFE